MKTWTEDFKEGLLVYAALLAVTFAAHFFWFTKFGLYEDDFVFVAVPANLDFSQILRLLKEIFAGNPEGRVIGFMLPHVFSYVLYNISGIPAMYLLGLIIVTTNGFLLFQLMKKVFPSLLAVFVAFFFILSPLDTTKGFLTHIYQLQISISFLLIGFHLYLHKKYTISCITAACSLLTYETAFLPFFFAPALENIQWRERKYLLRQIKHAIIFAFIVLAAVMWRQVTNEARIERLFEQLVLNDVVFKTLKSLFIGPVVAIYSYLHAISEAWANNKISALFILPSFAFFTLFFLFYSRKHTFQKISEPVNIKLETISIGTSLKLEVKIPLKAIILGGIMLVFSYLLAAPGSYYPPVALAGRGTSVHLPASISSAILMGGIFYLLYLIFARYRLKIISILLISFFCSSYVGYGGIVQNDFVRSWGFQKDFWNQVVQLCPDMNDGTTIIIERKDLLETKYILSHSWADSLILEQLLSFPKTWHKPPRFAVIEKSLDKDIFIKDGKFYFKFIFFGNKKNAELLQANTIYLQGKKGTYLRKTGGILIRDTVFGLKPTGDAAPDLKKKNMYYFMIDHLPKGHYAQ
ncbi:MAG: hypothetical protein A2X34_07160 [Elusimicrobia bacterium GWC2_51_8]|nr:MAG: hypothetical protein A2X33_05930 [Elusimicrobia bacterium GWA2_51_34]OGR62678.1 MAG: hypothetical protein A2X34_07160 [Elusimicrobia bacterium GWC2_51_8]OGR88184.1 MAG: hypothetical protein A2021_01070 [Elusimicrobia bacterium GWF2_52_66]HAF95388.1 hypothetical protein [Elusimicrobiota bacterium]HCE98747.1 hypothetical protein [Elusimicrobiota bacterium]